ncbi:MAG: zinc-ribbon domain-containing protein [Pseudomonadota bacterium]
MDITCPNCKTEYEFDDDKITTAGVTVKCTNCDSTFKLRRRQVSGTTPATASTIPPENVAKPWTIRTGDGAIHQFDEMPTLQQWIVERRVSRDDEISRAGENWKRLGDIAELGSFFQVVDAARKAETSQSREIDRLSKSTIPDTQLPADGAENRGLRFSTTKTQFTGVGQQAAWEQTGGGLNAPTVTTEMASELMSHRKGAKTIVIVSVALLLLGGAAFALWKTNVFKNIVGPNKQTSEKFNKGRELFLRDDLQSLSQAEDLFAKEPKEDALNNAARAEVHTAWAQLLLDKAELLERKAKHIVKTDLNEASAKQNEPGDNATHSPSQTELLDKAKELRQEANTHLEQAQINANAAYTTNPKKPEVNRALANCRRLQGKQGAEVLGLLKNAKRSQPNDPENAFVEGVYWEGVGDRDRAIRLLLASMKINNSQKPFIRAAFQLAMINLRAHRLQEAKQLAQTVLASNPQHELAKELLMETESKPSEQTPVVSSLEKEQPAATPTPAAPPTPPKESALPAPVPEPTCKTYACFTELGDKHGEHGRTMQALDAYNAALKLNSKGASAITGLAFCQLDLQRYSVAIQRFRQAMNISPTFGDAMIGMAESYKAMGNKQKALDYYKAYLRAHPGGTKANLAQRNAASLEKELGLPAQQETPPETKEQQPSEAQESEQTPPAAEKQKPAEETPANNPATDELQPTEVKVEDPDETPPNNPPQNSPPAETSPPSKTEPVQDPENN